MTIVDGRGAIRLKNKIAAVLKNKSGVSLLFVAGVTLFLMAIGASVMAAASANIGANIRQDRYNMAVVLIDSIHKNIKHSLQMPPNSIDFEDSFANIIPQAIYYASLEPDDPPDPYNPQIGVSFTEIELDLEIGGVTDINNIQSITLGFPFQEVRLAGPVGSVPETGAPRIPRTANISARMIVVVTVEINATGFGAENRIVTTHATYEYSGGVFSDKDDPRVDLNEDDDDFVFIGNMDFVDYGKWELVSYEIVESQTEEN